MKLWLITSGNDGYDAFDEAVVAAETEDEARHTHPGDEPWRNDNWTRPEKVTVKEIGTALEGQKAGIICASFNAS